MVPRAGDCANFRTALCLRHADPCVGSDLGDRNVMGRKNPLLICVGAMHRLIAKTLLFILLAGIYSPFASASAMSVSHPHCNRKPVPTPASAEMAGCHHHGAQAPDPALPASNDQVLGAKDCCQDHECCRSMARSQWAHASLNSNSSQPGDTAQAPLPIFSDSRSAAAALDHSGRAPPIL